MMWPMLSIPYAWKEGQLEILPEAVRSILDACQTALFVLVIRWSGVSSMTFTHRVQLGWQDAGTNLTVSLVRTIRGAAGNNHVPCIARRLILKTKRTWKTPLQQHQCHNQTEAPQRRQQYSRKLLWMLSCGHSCTCKIGWSAYSEIETCQG